MSPIYSHLLVAIASFVAGIFIYRNNVDLLTPMASKIDERFDAMELKMQEEIAKVKARKATARKK
jgi:hypothetical protein